VTKRLALLSSAGLGGYLFYETHVRHHSHLEGNEARPGRYEKEWKSWDAKATPRIVDADVNFDIYPDAHRRASRPGALPPRHKTTEADHRGELNLVDNAKVDALAIRQRTPRSK